MKFKLIQFIAIFVNYIYIYQSLKSYIFNNKNWIILELKIGLYLKYVFLCTTIIQRNYML